MTTPALIGLKCPQCSAPMKAVEERRFLCEHCGCETMLAAPQIDVERVAADAARAATGSERTAAELALPRLLHERDRIGFEYAKVKGEVESRRTINAIAMGFGALLALALALTGFLYNVWAGCLFLMLLSLVITVFGHRAWRYALEIPADDAAELAEATRRYHEAERKVRAAKAVTGAL